MARHTIDGTNWKNPTSIEEYATKIIDHMQRSRDIIARAKAEGRKLASWNPEGLPEGGVSSLSKAREWTAARRLRDAGVIVVASGDLDGNADYAYFLPGPNFPAA